MPATQFLLDRLGWRAALEVLAPMPTALFREVSGSYQLALWLGIAVCLPVLGAFMLAAFTRPRDQHSSPPTAP